MTIKVENEVKCIKPVQQADGTIKRMNGYELSYENVLAALRREVAANLVLPDDEVEA